MTNPDGARPQRPVAALLPVVAALVLPAPGLATTWGEPRVMTEFDSASPSARVDRGGSARVLTVSLAPRPQMVKLDRRSRVLARCRLPDLGRRSDPGLPRPFLDWEVSPDGSALVAWHYDEQPSDRRRVAAVSARPGGCFGKRQVLSPADRGASFNGAEAGPGGTLLAHWAEGAGNGLRLAFASGRAGARLARRGIIAKSDRYGDPIAASAGLTSGDRAVFTWATHERTRIDPPEHATRIWGATTARNAGRPGRRTLIGGEDIGPTYPLTARDGMQLAFSAHQGRLRIWGRPPNRAYREFASIPAPTGENTGTFSESDSAIEPGGAAVHAWTVGSGLHAAVRRRDGRVVGPQLLTAGDPADVSSVATAIDGSGRAVVTWTAGRDAVASVAGRDGRFGPPATISRPESIPYSDPYVAVNARGEAAVVWGTYGERDENGNVVTEPLVVVRGRLGG